MRKHESSSDLESRVSGPRVQPAARAPRRVVAATTAVVVFAAAFFVVRTLGPGSDDPGALLPGGDASRVLEPRPAASDGDVSVDSSASGVDWSTRSELPTPHRTRYRSEFVSEEEGYRYWPRSGTAEVGVAYRFETEHCGLSFLADFDASFWQPVNPSAGEPPSFFHNQDVGEIALISSDTAVFRSSEGVEAVLTRIDGPVTGFCE